MLLLSGRFLTSLLEICWQASAVIPLIAALGLVAGRRGNAPFYLAGNQQLINFGLFLSIPGILYFPATYLCQVLAFHGSAESSLWQPFFLPPGLPCSTGMLAEIAGFVMLLFARKSLSRINFHGDKYSLIFIKKVPVFCLLATLCYLATFFLVSWPFAGLPPELPMDRAIMAVLRNAVRHYFMAFTPAGALALLLVIYENNAKRIRISESNLVLSMRWLALWAFVGHLPYLMQSWAIVLGAGFRGNIANFFPGNFLHHILSLSLLSMAVCLWCLQCLLKKYLPLLAICAFTFYIARICVPYVIQITAN